MLTSFDDYPIHQASVPVAHSASGDINQYDRYFFNGYSRDGSLYFAAAMGLYPNRHVADAAFCVVLDGKHHSVFRSQRAPLDRADATTLGPIVVEVVQPLQVLRLKIDAPDQGIRAELTFTGREVVVLVDLEERPATEVAELLGVPVGTIYSRLHHARRAFAAALERRGPAG